MPGVLDSLRGWSRVFPPDAGSPRHGEPQYRIAQDGVEWTLSPDPAHATDYVLTCNQDGERVYVETVPQKAALRAGRGERASARPPKWEEASVTVDGVTLNGAQVMALRVAVSGMITDLKGNPERLGTDAHGRFMHAAYLARLREVEALLVEGAQRRGTAATRSG